MLVATTTADRLGHVHGWVLAAARAASGKKAADVVAFDVGAVLAITDAFVVASGSNPRQVRTIADEVEARVKQAGGPSPLAVEGRDAAQWILLDYGDFVVHVFLDEVRRYYDLERLWSDAPRIDWDDPDWRARADGTRVAGAAAD